MIFTIPKKDILAQLLLQLKGHFLITSEEEILLNAHFDHALNACETNFSQSENKYFHVETEEGRTCRFNPYHSVQYMIFLYYLSHELYKNSAGDICDKLYYLNKIFHAVDLFYAIDLPEHFGAEHPLGSVMGRAKYGNGFFFYQGCTVGGTRNREGSLFYPVIGENVHMFSNSSILGNSHIGNNVDIGAGAIVKNQDIPDDSIVFGESPNLIIKMKKK